MPINDKWQYFVIGLFFGIILFGAAILVFFTPKAIPQSVSRPSDNLINPDKTLIPFSIEGKINLNKASINELMQIPGIGEVKALAIVEYRNKYGFFENIEELLYVPGIGDSLLEVLREQIYIE